MLMLLREASGVRPGLNALAGGRLVVQIML